jgi:hypothetical protein
MRATEVIRMMELVKKIHCPQWNFTEEDVQEWQEKLFDIHILCVIDHICEHMMITYLPPRIDDAIGLNHIGWVAPSHLCFKILAQVEDRPEQNQ